MKINERLHQSRVLFIRGAAVFSLVLGLSPAFADDLPGTVAAELETEISAQGIEALASMTRNLRHAVAGELRAEIPTQGRNTLASMVEELPDQVQQDIARQSTTVVDEGTASANLGPLVAPDGKAQTTRGTLAAAH